MSIHVMNEEWRSSYKAPYGIHYPVTLKCNLNAFADNRALSIPETPQTSVHAYAEQSRTYPGRHRGGVASSGQHCAESGVTCPCL